MRLFSRLLPLLVVSASMLHADRPPNVIVIITDDQGYGDMSCHGNPLLKTPNMDQLYGESLRLTDFHVDPTCSPTRSALMSVAHHQRPLDDAPAGTDHG